MKKENEQWFSLMEHPNAPLNYKPNIIGIRTANKISKYVQLYKNEHGRYLVEVESEREDKNSNEIVYEPKRLAPEIKKGIAGAFENFFARYSPKQLDIDLAKKKTDKSKKRLLERRIRDIEAGKIFDDKKGNKRSVHLDADHPIVEDFLRYAKRLLKDIDFQILSDEDDKEEEREPKTTAPAIALFCRIMNYTMREQQPHETNEKYCQNLCSDFKLCYNDKVRQWYSKQPKDKHYSGLKKAIIPLLDKETSQIINDYLTVNHYNK